MRAVQFSVDQTPSTLDPYQHHNTTTKSHESAAHPGEKLAIVRQKQKLLFISPDKRGLLVGLKIRRALLVVGGAKHGHAKRALPHGDVHRVVCKEYRARELPCLVLCLIGFD